MNEHFVIQLLHKHYTGVLEQKDRDLLLDWLQESPENQSYGDSIKEIWEYSSNYSPSVDFESKTESAFQKFSSKIREEAAETVPEVQAPVEVPIAKSRRLPSTAWLSAAAACLVLIAGTTWMLTKATPMEQSDLLTSVSTISDQQEKLSLIDGSEIWVNQKTNIKHFEKMSDETRSVILNGEAYFEVQKSSKPFTVTSENATVTVLGTEFNVDSDSNGTVVHVKSGKVELRPLNSSQAIELTANQIGVYDAVNKKLYRRQSKSYNGDSWKTGGFSFEDAKLSEVFDVLEDYYDLDIYVENTDLKNCVFTSPVYQNAKIDEVLSVMELIYNFSYIEDEKTENRLIIKGGKCSL
ncbi:FecR domain-containing protein [Saprospiraceae bacterium]|nr:FecR domain-containing protein [Saprospiraceae bacterium]